MSCFCKWPVDRRVAPGKGVRSYWGKSLHLPEVVTPGKIFVRRILNQLGQAPVKAGETGGGFVVGSTRKREVVRLNREFHDDLASWRLVIEVATGPDGITRLGAPLFACYL